MDRLHTRPFGSLLIANRGEIALRVMRAARAAGIRTVAVWSDADRDASHVRAADDAVRIGPTPAAESYLSVDALLDACARTGAEAVHPGYGFLSERAVLARAVTDAGLVFVGPPADVMEAMGRKDRARHLALAAGLPVVPSFDLAPSGGARTRPHGDAWPGGVAYPVLVKAAAGGGGKGMRVVRDPTALPAALDAARREAGSAFGDDTLLLERFVERGRHVEVQVIADAHGTVLHLYERDCSVQRRHQKVLEEAPAPTIANDLRRRLCESAVALAREVGYVNAGTVEFLVAGEEFFFLEMNTRLQVEHPVTEAVTGLDVVRMQLDVAAGHRLGVGQGDIAVAGHAIEARIYAEDPYAGFLPQAGRATYVCWPDSDHARVDAALESGQEVPTAYDPMLGKVVAHGATRDAARRRLVAALDRTVIVGLRTNVGFLRELAASGTYAAAGIHTDWLDSDPAAEAVTAAPSVPDEVWDRAARAVLEQTGDDADADDPFGARDGWRLGGPPAPSQVTLAHGAETRVLHVEPGADASTGGDQSAEWVGAGAHHVTVVRRGHAFVLDRPDAFGPGAGGARGDSDVVAPMPGTVLAVRVAAGDAVASGQPLGVLEAMKMELTLVAPFDGSVAVVGAEPGAQVPIGHLLFRVEPVEGA